MTTTESDFTAQARQALGANAAGVDFCIELTSLPNGPVGPSFVILSLDVTSLGAILRRSAAAVDHDLEMSTVCEPKSFDPQAQFKVRLLKIVSTGAGQIWLHGDSDSSAVVTSHRIAVATVMARLSNRTILGPRFRWVGGALLSAESSIEIFADIVLSRCPEIAARETEIQMAARIGVGTSAIGNLPELAAAAPRRRPGV